METREKELRARVPTLRDQISSTETLKLFETLPEIDERDTTSSIGFIVLRSSYGQDGPGPMTDSG